MDKDYTQTLQERTNAKVRFARVHLEELKGHGPPDGSDFDKAHQESFLFHLLGTKDALLAELNHYYAGGLPYDELSLGKVRNAFKERGIHSQELQEIYELENDDGSWYAHAKQMRDHSTHLQGVRRAYFLGGENHRKVRLMHPQSGELTDEHFVIEFEAWLALMEALVYKLRISALLNASALHDF